MLDGACSRTSRSLRQAMTWARVTGAQLGRAAQAGEGDEFLDVDLVGAAGFGIGEVGEPFEFGRYVGELAVLRRRQRRLFNRNRVLGHHPAVFRQPPYPAISNTIM